MSDALGNRMKTQYEQRVRLMLPRRTYTIVRLDGRAFHTYTRNLARPYDWQFIEDMAETARFLCSEVAGCRLAYTQSDEISLILTDFTTPTTEAFFDGNQQKIVSITASMATAKFNQRRPGRLAFFDSRAFTIPDPVEVENYLIWRQMDAVRNSISMAAQAYFSHNALHQVNTKRMQEMLFSEHGVNWNDYDPRFKRGTVVVPLTTRGPVTYTDRRTGQIQTTEAVERRTWTIMDPTPDFAKEREWLPDLLTIGVVNIE
jgi:tRNA(His) 5'-end guanylyltransferase